MQAGSGTSRSRGKLTTVTWERSAAMFTSIMTSELLESWPSRLSVPSTRICSESVLVSAGSLGLVLPNVQRLGVEVALQPQQLHAGEDQPGDQGQGEQHRNRRQARGVPRARLRCPDDGRRVRRPSGVGLVRQIRRDHDL